jgi:Uma2 family endonuclease
MVASFSPTFTVREYLALEGASETKHEFSGGRILAMAGAELAHNRIAMSVGREIDTQLEAHRCKTLGSDQRVIVEATSEYFYPDISVTGLEPVLVEPRPRSLANPQVIVEVLSPTTAGYDRGDKWAAYRMIPTLTDYVMISSTSREMEHYRRAGDGTWTYQSLVSGAITLSNGVTLEVDRIYRGVEF